MLKDPTCDICVGNETGYIVFLLQTALTQPNAEQLLEEIITCCTLKLIFDYVEQIAHGPLTHKYSALNVH